MTTSRRLGVLGGTFDPIHLGHLDAARAARRALDLDDVLLMPARVPPHKAAAPLASAWHRFAMAALAASDQPDLRVSDIELQEAGPSYTARTLDQARPGPAIGRARSSSSPGPTPSRRSPPGATIPTCSTRSHFVVVSRPGNAADHMPRRLPDLAARMRSPQGADTTAGDPDATGIWLVAAPTRDVSSSSVRACVGRGQAVDRLVPPAVATHIARHDLYVPSRGERLA